MDQALVLISSNIRFDNPADGKLAWPFRKDLLAQVLLAHSPLLIGTQEGRRPQLEELAGLLPSHQLQDQNRPWIAERMYPSFYVRQGVSIDEGGDLWLSATPEVPGSVFAGSAFPRLCTWLRFERRQRRLLVVNTHLDYLDENVRVSQARVLVREIQRLLQPQDELVLMGDFNDAPHSPCYRTLLQGLPRLRDPWTELRLAETPSHRSFTHAYEEAHRIDWMLVDKKISVERMALDRTHRGELWPSDHFPLVCALRL